MKLTIERATNKDAENIQKLIFSIWNNEYNFDVKLEDYSRFTIYRNILF